MKFDILFLQAVSCPDCLWKVILMFLLALLLGLLLGYFLWHKYKKMVDAANKESNDLKVKLTDMEKDYASLKYQHDELNKDNSGLKSSLGKCEADKAVLEAQLAQARANADDGGSGPGIVAGSTGAGDVVAAGPLTVGGLFDDSNLQIVEGIGPKIEGILHDKGIANWTALAASTVENLNTILTEAGPNYRIHNPKSWPEQAKLAANGDWDKLVEYQKFLDGGREDEGDFDTPSKVEKMIAKKLKFAKYKATDLKIIEGIGPKIDQALKDGGIKNWNDLAAATPDQIQKILDEADGNFNMHDPATWPQQAGLAAQSKWIELKNLQDRLDGGKA